MKLESWYLKFEGLIVPPDRFFHSDTEHRPSLCGLVYGKLGFKDGQTVMLSPVKYIMKKMIYTESGSIYEMGEPNPDYLKMHPNIREDLLRLFF